MSNGKTIAIVGAGPGLGLSIARKFGREGYAVALVARDPAKVNALVEELAGDSIVASGHLADVTNEAALAAAFDEIRARHGAIDVLEYSPIVIPTDPQAFARLAVDTLEPAVAQEIFAVMAGGAVSAVKQVLPAMIERGEGAILITMGIGAKGFMPAIGAWGMAGSAARNYARTLASAVRDRGVFVAPVCLGVQIAKGDPNGDPDLLADRYYDYLQTRDAPELVINHLPEGYIELDHG